MVEQKSYNHTVSFKTKPDHESKLEYSILHHQTKIHKLEERSASIDRMPSTGVGLVMQNSSDLMGYLNFCMVFLVLYVLMYTRPRQKKLKIKIQICQDNI